MANKFWNEFSSGSSSYSHTTEYDSPIALWRAAVEYFEFTDDNPLQQNVHAFSQGSLVSDSIDKPRAMSLMALCRFIGVSRNQWKKMKEGKLDFTPICEKIEDVIYTQKYELAASEILNPNFIARDLGMGDKNTLLGAGAKGEHLTVSGFDVSNLSLEQLNVLETALIEALTPKPPGLI